MNVSPGDAWERYVENVVREGRYGSVDDVVREALRLFRDRDETYRPLREQIERDIAAGDWVSDDEVEAAIQARLADLARRDDAA